MAPPAIRGRGCGGPGAAAGAHDKVVHRSRDWEKLNTAQVKAAVLENAAPNQIILLHDIYDTSVDAALEIVDTLQGEGYRFVTVQELLEANGIQPEAGVLYCSGDI